jgi:hypothetical protein
MDEDLSRGCHTQQAPLDFVAIKLAELQLLCVASNDTLQELKCLDRKQWFVAHSFMLAAICPPGGILRSSAEMIAVWFGRRQQPSHGRRGAKASLLSLESA